MMMKGCSNVAGLVFILFAFSAAKAQMVDDSSTTTEGGCSICRDGSSLGLPDRVVDVGLGSMTCRELASQLPILIPDSSHPDCQTIRSMESICGCPSEAQSCALCKNNGLMHAPEKELAFLLDIGDDLMFAEGTQLDFVPTCELVDAYLRTSRKVTGPTCNAAQNFLDELCECSDKVNTGDAIQVASGACTLCKDGSTTVIDTKDYFYEGCLDAKEILAATATQDSEKCQDFQSISTICGCPVRDDACTLCPDGSHAPDQQTSLKFLKGTFQGFSPTCATYEAFAESFAKDSDMCYMLQTSSSLCGCPSLVSNACDAYGSDNLDAEYSDVELDSDLLNALGIPLDHKYPFTCAVAVHYQYGLDKNDQRCHLLRSRDDVCGINDGVISYAGATTDREKSILAWLPRLSGFLSIAGSLAIVLKVVFFSATNHFTVYNQLMLGMSIVDILSSASWVVSTSASPTGDLWSIYGENGNEATCKAQAFFLQLSLATLCYNVALAVYFYMIVVNRSPSQLIKRAGQYLHIIPALGIVLALAGIPFYGSMLVTCHLLAPPLMTDTWLPAILFQFVPVSLGIVVITTLTSMVCYKVYQQIHKEAARADIAIDQETLSIDNKAERSVSIQAVGYCISACVSWISSLLLFGSQGSYSYTLSCTTLFLIPLQGALNYVVFVRHSCSCSDCGNLCFGCGCKSSTVLLIEDPNDSGEQSSGTKRREIGRTILEGSSLSFPSHSHSHVLVPSEYLEARELQEAENITAVTATS